MVKLFALKLIALENKENSSSLLKYVSLTKQKRIRKFLKPEDAHRTLYADLLVRYLIRKKTGINNREICFFFNKYKKPFLKHNTPFYFNISHSGQWIICAIGKKPVGVDIEKITEIDFDIANDVFSTEERKCFLSCDEGKKSDFFFKIWTLKESYMKAVGQGFYCPPGSFSIKFLNPDNIKLIKKGNVSNDFFFKIVDIDKNYKSSLCSTSNKFSEFVTYINQNDLANHFINLNEEKKYDN